MDALLQRPRETHPTPTPRSRKPEVILPIADPKAVDAVIGMSDALLPVLHASHLDERQVALLLLPKRLAFLKVLQDEVKAEDKRNTFLKRSLDRIESSWPGFLGNITSKFGWIVPENLKNIIQECGAEKKVSFAAQEIKRIEGISPNLLRNLDEGHPFVKHLVFKAQSLFPGAKERSTRNRLSEIAAEIFQYSGTEHGGNRDGSLYISVARKKLQDRSQGMRQPPLIRTMAISDSNNDFFHDVEMPSVY